MVATDDHVKICVIDVRLGKHEENTEEQLLGAWSYRPQTESAMMDIVRLARGSMGFCSHFQTVSSFLFFLHRFVSAVKEALPQVGAGAGRVQFCSLIRDF